MRRGRSLLAAAVVLTLVWFPTGAPLAADAGSDGTERDTVQFEVTAYSLGGRTASGTRVREGVVAADPDLLPFGSRVRLLDAGKYSGVYVVEDTGPAIEGRELDIYVASTTEALRFGRRQIEVQILRRGRD